MPAAPVGLRMRWHIAGGNGAHYRYCCELTTHHHGIFILLFEITDMTNDMAGWLLYVDNDYIYTKKYHVTNTLPSNT